MIHSVDSLRLAEEISKESVKKDVCTEILIEVNVAGEENKLVLHPKMFFLNWKKWQHFRTLKYGV